MGAATAVAIGSAVAGAYSANRQASAANRASRQQDQAAAQQAAFAREQLDWNKERYGEWSNLFMPIFGELRDEAFADNGPDFSGIAGDVGMSFDSSQAINRRNMERYGVKPTDGAMADSETRYGLGRANAMVNARNNARMAHKGQRFAQLSQLYGMGNTMLSSALGGVNQGYGSVTGVMGDQAAAAGNRAALHGQGAAAGMNAAINGIGNAIGSRGQGNGGGGTGGGSYASRGYPPGY